MRRIQLLMILATAATGALTLPIFGQFDGREQTAERNKLAEMAAAVAAAQTPAAPAPEATPATAPMDPFTRALLARLNSTDSAQRDAARKELEDISHVWQQSELLLKMKEITNSDDLKSAIDDRLNDLKARRMQLDLQHLPNISLNVSGASLSDLSTAFNEALHTPSAFLNVVGRGRGAGGSYTLDVKDKPFWEVFFALSQQQPLTMSSSTNGTQLMNSGVRVQRFAVDGPAMAYVGDIVYQRNVTLQTPGGDSPPSTSMYAQVTYAIDPRVRVAQLTAPTTTNAVDDTGASMLVRNSGVTRFGNTNANMVTYSVQLKPAPTMGKTLTLTLEGTVNAVATEAIGTIKDLENNTGQSVTVAGRTIAMSRFVVNGSTISINLNLQNTVPNTNQNLRPMAMVFDSSGKMIWSYSLSGGVGSSIQTGTSTGPYKLEIHVPDKTVDIPVKLLLKDVPLP